MRSVLAFFFTTSLLVAKAPQIKVEETYKNQKLKLPVALAIPPDGSKRLFLVQQVGKITILPGDRKSDKETTFLDLTSRPLIKKQFEEGLLELVLGFFSLIRVEVVNLL
ncbi:MAG: hypothetical protein ACON38_13925, partial [Akkermansiaceae bacterium]